jgi:hypothetical protein
LPKSIKRRVQRRAGGRVENEPRRIGLAADAERMHLQRRLAVRDARANFQHVRAEDELVARLQMIGVILHERRAALEAARHDFHRADERGGFPIAFAGETVAVRHQALRREAGQLHQTVQIFKRRGETLEFPPSETRATRVRCARLRGRIVALAAFFQIGGDFISRLVGFARARQFPFRKLH